MQLERLEVLENLVDELMKEHPEDKLVKQYMKQTGIKYSEDPIERLNLVLQALHFTDSNETATAKEKE